MKTVRAKFPCPIHFWDADGLLECTDCLSMPTISGRGARSFRVEFSHRALPSKRMLRWALTVWAERHAEKANRTDGTDGTDRMKAPKMP